MPDESLVGRRCLLPSCMGPLGPYKRGVKHGYSGTGWIVTIVGEEGESVTVKYIGKTGTRTLDKSWISVLKDQGEQ